MNLTILLVYAAEYTNHLGRRKPCCNSNVLREKYTYV